MTPSLPVVYIRYLDIQLNCEPGISTPKITADFLLLYVTLAPGSRLANYNKNALIVALFSWYPTFAPLFSRFHPPPHPPPPRPPGSLGCCGVGSVPSVRPHILNRSTLQTNLLQVPLTIIPHLIFAFLFFVGGIIYVNIIVYIDSKSPDIPPHVLRTRRACAYLSVFFFMGYFPLQVPSPSTPNFHP